MFTKWLARLDALDSPCRQLPAAWKTGVAVCPTNPAFIAVSGAILSVQLLGTASGYSEQTSGGHEVALGHWSCKWTKVAPNDEQLIPVPYCSLGQKGSPLFWPGPKLRRGTPFRQQPAKMMCLPRGPDGLGSNKLVVWNVRVSPLLEVCGFSLCLSVCVCVCVSVNVTTCMFRCLLLSL